MNIRSALKHHYTVIKHEQAVTLPFVEAFKDQ